MSLAPGQVVTNANASIPVVRVVCRYPFDAPEALPRWVIEHINQPARTVEIVDEAALSGYSLLFAAAINVPLDGSEANS